MRFYEIDFLRGIAVVMMIFFHLFFDLRFFGIYGFESSVFWWFFPRLIASIFIFLVGVSLTLSYSRIMERPRKEILKKYIFRGVKIFSWGIVITMVTLLLIGEGIIVFGVLHFIGLSVILAIPFLRRREFNLWLGMVVIMIGLYMATFRFDFPFLLWLGFIPSGFYTLDYFPVFPWFGLVLIGLFFGNTFYPRGKRSFKIKEIKNPLTNFFGLIGRNSLSLYLVHHPIILFVILLLI